MIRRKQRDEILKRTSWNRGDHEEEFAKEGLVQSGDWSEVGVLGERGRRWPRRSEEGGSKESSSRSRKLPREEARSIALGGRFERGGSRRLERQRWSRGGKGRKVGREGDGRCGHKAELFFNSSWDGDVLSRSYVSEAQILSTRRVGS